MTANDVTMMVSILLMSESKLLTEFLQVSYFRQNESNFIKEMDDGMQHNYYYNLLLTVR